MKGLLLSHCHLSKCSTHCNDSDMFITLGYLCHIGLCLSHYDDRSMFVTFQRYYVCLNVKLLWLSNCEEAMFITLWWQGYINHIAKIINVLHIVTMGLYFSHYDDKAMFVTFWHYYVCQNLMLLWSSHYDNMAMFVTLRWWALVYHKQGGNVHHIVMMRLYFSYCNNNKCWFHCDARSRFVTLWQ